MRGRRVYPPPLGAVAISLALAGCGDSSDGPVLAPPAKPRTIRLGWLERYRAAQFTLRVDRLVIGDDGWSARVSMTNGSRTPYRLDQRTVGLVLLDTATRAELERLTGNLTHAPP